MQAGAPAVRAKFLQHWLTFSERYDPPAAARVAQLLGEEKRRAIMDVSMLSWLPIELDVEIVDLVAGVMGPSRFRQFARAYFAEIMPRPPLGALLELGSKMLGLSPQSFLRWWDKGWGAIYRGCGTVRGTVLSETRGRVMYDALPRVCMQSEAFVEALLSSSYGIYALTGHTGVVCVENKRLDDGHLELAFEWQARAEHAAQS